ncbi:MAG: SdiA-regulated domain-containing protein [Candidatus Marinimicrobia bacterium]|nr:SdiA-regulated domain-containing protein [Candidatus Neomarinimicrobiota bacterium]
MKLRWFMGFSFILTACSLDEIKPDESKSQLVLIESVSLEVPEPSGLTLNNGANALYVVSDPPDNSVYKLDLLGNKIKKLSYYGDDLEGISYDNRDHTLWIAEERLREVVHIDTLGNELERFSINFEGTSSSSGFEGILLNPSTNNIVLLNEKLPGTFIELDSSMNISLEYALDFASDYSGICFNTTSGNYLIVSDESQELIEWNFDKRIIKTYSLDIEKAEGVAYNPETDRIYIVSDSEQKLYIYEFQH